MKIIFISLIFYLVLVQVHSSDDEKLIRINIKTERDAEVLKNFSLSNSDRVDIWNHPFVDSKVLAQFTKNSLKEFSYLGVSFEVANENVTKLFEQDIEKQKIKTIFRQTLLSTIGLENFFDNFNLDEYHSYDEIIEYLKSIERKSSSTIGAKLVPIGKTYENRQIYALTISKEALVKKKIIMFECTIHAREWISSAACLKMINKFMVDQDDIASKILNQFDVHLIPVMNPDGYEFTRNHNRAWRKNRGRNFIPICRGTDVNRNFDVAFGTVGVDKYNPCSLIYCGRKAFSENESKALRDYALSLGDSLQVYVSLHSFSQLLMYPYGFSSEKPKNDDKLLELATLAQKAIESKQGEYYKIGNIYTAIYPASGSTLDWIAMNTKCEFVWIFEMRDRGEFGFMLPESLIEPAFQDVWIGLEQLILNIN